MLVLNSEGSLHFCIDFRKVYIISNCDAYTIPWVNKLLDWLREAHYITTLDLMKGYWQIPLKPESHYLTYLILRLCLLGYTRQ